MLFRLVILVLFTIFYRVETRTKEVTVHVQPSPNTIQTYADLDAISFVLEVLSTSLTDYNITWRISGRKGFNHWYITIPHMQLAGYYSYATFTRGGDTRLRKFSKSDASSTSFSIHLDPAASSDNNIISISISIQPVRLAWTVVAILATSYTTNVYNSSLVRCKDTTFPMYIDRSLVADEFENCPRDPTKPTTVSPTSYLMYYLLIPGIPALCLVLVMIIFAFKLNTCCPKVNSNAINVSMQCAPNHSANGNVLRFSSNYGQPNSSMNSGQTIPQPPTYKKLPDDTLVPVEQASPPPAYTA